MKTFLITISILLIALLANAATPATDSIAVARAALRNIWKASEAYYGDGGKWPVTVTELLKQHYLNVDSAVKQDWSFELELGPRKFIATSVATRRMMEEGEWSDRHSRVSFDVVSGRWEGDGKRYDFRDTLTAAEESVLTLDARNAMKAIWCGAAVYIEDRGILPETVDELLANRYVGIWQPSTDPELVPDIVLPSVFTSWEFALIGDPPEKVVAISTTEMPAGAGRWIELNGINRTWRGYGVTASADSAASPIKFHQYYKQQR